MHPIGQHFIAGFDGMAVTNEVRELILKDKILGFTLFKWNIESAEQLCALNTELQALARQAGYELILAVDQEGGRVQRLPKPFTPIPSMRQCAEACQHGAPTTLLFELGRILGHEASLAGFNLNFAPVVDVDSNPKNPVIGNRSFAEDALTVCRHAKDIIRGLMREGVIPCLKHFPGHGATLKDSHLELPVDKRGLKEILGTDVLPYRMLIDEHLAPTLMTAHVLYPKIDAHNPATLSKKIIHDILREDMGYDGVVFSDDLLMQAIADNYDLVTVVKKFFTIGGDVALICKHPELSREIISKVSTDVTSGSSELIVCLDQSYQRIQNLKRQFLPSFQKKEPLAVVTARHQAYIDKVFRD